MHILLGARVMIVMMVMMVMMVKKSLQSVALPSPADNQTQPAEHSSHVMSACRFMPFRQHAKRHPLKASKMKRGSAILKMT